MTEPSFDIEDAEEFRESLNDLLAAAEQGGVSTDAMAGLLTAYLARMRGDVRLPLGMPPERAREFREEAENHRQQTMEVELLITGEVLDELDLQLSAFGEAVDQPADVSTIDDEEVPDGGDE